MTHKRPHGVKLREPGKVRGRAAPRLAQQLFSPRRRWASFVSLARQQVAVRSITPSARDTQSERGA